MPRIIETVVYDIGELSGAAKEAARRWYRQEGLHDDWHDAVRADFETVCGIVGVTLATTPVPLHGGGTRDRPRIFFRLAFSQGDGASWEGSYNYARGAARAIRAYAPVDRELHRIADVLHATQRRNFHQLHASVRHRGRHCHEYAMAVEVERDSPTGQPPTDGAESAVTEALRDLARWLHRRLRSEYEHQTSDRAVDEALAANDYTFTANGRRFG